MSQCDCNQGRLPCTCKGPDRDQFEAAYAEWSGRDLENVRDQRMGITYGQPKIATAWRWFQFGAGVPV